MEKAVILTIVRRQIPDREIVRSFCPAAAMLAPLAP